MWPKARRIVAASVVALGVALSIFVVREQTRGVPIGHALLQSDGSEFGVWQNRTGTSIGIVYLPIDNVGGKPITLDHAVLSGRGLHGVVKVLHLEVNTVGIYLSSYVTYPPATTAGHKRAPCVVGRLVAVHGTVLPAGSRWQMYVALHYLHPGRFRVNTTDIYYRTASGTLEHQVEPVAIAGRVASNAPVLRIGPSEKSCLRRRETGLLPEPYRARVLHVIGETG